MYFIKTFLIIVFVQMKMMTCRHTCSFGNDIKSCPVLFLRIPKEGRKTGRCQSTALLTTFLNLFFDSAWPWKKASVSSRGKSPCRTGTSSRYFRSAGHRFRRLFSPSTDCARKPGSSRWQKQLRKSSGRSHSSDIPPGKARISDILPQSIDACDPCPRTDGIPRCTHWPSSDFREWRICPRPDRG